MNLPSALYVLRWMVRDTFRQSLGSRAFWLILGLSGLAILLCLSIRIEGYTAITPAGAAALQRQALRVAVAPAEDLGSRLGPADERIVARDRAVVLESHDLAGAVAQVLRRSCARGFGRSPSASARSGDPISSMASRAIPIDHGCDPRAFSSVKPNPKWPPAFLSKRK